MSFENNIQQWVSIDNKLRILNEQTKILREQKQCVTSQITNYVTSNNLIDKRIPLNDGQLRFSNIKETQPLTFKYLETCLKEIIKNDEQVVKILDYVKKKREVKVNQDIKRLYNK